MGILSLREGIKSWENDGNGIYAFHGPTPDICKREREDIGERGRERGRNIISKVNDK